MTERLVLTVPEAAETLQCSRSLLYRLISLGEIEIVKVGGLTRIPVVSVRAYLDRHTGRIGLVS